ncbi:MAG: chemotaxis protein CheB [Terriglobales bacterium]
MPQRRSIAMHAPAEDTSAAQKIQVVAIGASAGGLQSLFAVLTPLPRSFTPSVLVVQHLSPEYPSHLADLLGRKLQLPLVPPVDGDDMAPGTVYVAPPDFHLLAEPSRVRLLQTPKVHHSRPSIDLLFESVAVNFGEHAIGIMLSGSGRDGAAGIQAIKRAGGITIAEDPSKAEFSAMPYAAVATGCVDYVLPLAKLAPCLIDLCR